MKKIDQEHAWNDLDFFERNIQHFLTTIVEWERKREKETRANESESWKEADYPWRNNRIDVHSYPVNENHFKRSRLQCIYLANVKFTCEKRRTACTSANTFTTSIHVLPLFSLHPEQNRIVLLRSIIGTWAWLVFSYCRSLTFLESSTFFWLVLGIT